MTSKFFSLEEQTSNVEAPRNDGLDWDEIDASGSLLHLTSGRDGSGRDYYAYIFVQPSKYKDLVENSESNIDINLHDYGLVVESGFGVLPPVEVQERMKKEYFFNHTYEDILLKNMVTEINKGYRDV